MARGRVTEVFEKQGKKYIRCECCGEVLELNSNNFYKDKHNNLGFRPKCKVCTRQYYNNPKTRVKRLAYQNRYNEEKFGTVHRSCNSFNKLKQSEKILLGMIKEGNVTSV